MMNTLIEKISAQNGTPVEKTMKLLQSYRDLQRGKEIVGDDRILLDIINQCFDVVKDDYYYLILEQNFKTGLSIHTIANNLGIDERKVWRQRKRLIRRISVIIFGDKAINEIIKK